MTAVTTTIGTVLIPSGGSDDSAMIQSYLDSGGVVALKGVFPIASGLRMDAQNSSLIGLGGGDIVDVGSNSPRSSLRWVGSAGGTMLTVEPDEGASAQNLARVAVTDIGLYGEGDAAYGLYCRSVFRGIFRVYVEHCTTAAVYTGCVSTLGEARDLQDCDFEIVADQNDTGDGSILICRGLTGGGANTSFNRFRVFGQYKDSTAVLLGDTDNNDLWVKVGRASGGAAYGVDMEAGPSLERIARSNRFWMLSPGTGGVIARGTEADTIASRNNWIFNYDRENGAPDPTVGTGASLRFYQDSRPLGIVGPSNKQVQTFLAQVESAGVEIPVSTTTPSAVGLSVSVDANKVYSFRFAGHYRTAATTTGIRFGLTAPSGSAFRASARVMTSATAEHVEQMETAIADGVAMAAATSGVDAADTGRSWSVEGVCIVGGTAGTLALRIASEVDGSEVRVGSGSFGLVHVVSNT